MAANFYLSSHANYHLHPRSALLAARSDDLKYATEQELGFIEIWSGTFIQKLCRRLSLRQAVTATAIVYFRRFYLRNAYCDTDPPLVAAACCYVAAKAEETPVHVKSAVAEAKEVCSEMGHRNFPTDNTRLAEQEFYLIEELDFSLIVFHPYRALVQLTGRDGGPQAGGKLGRERRENMLEMDDTALQMAWFVINDTYRSSLILVYPPHLIALAAIYLGLALHPPSTSAAPSAVTGGKTDAITFLASLAVDHSIILEIVQEILALYELWNALESPSAAPSSSPAPSSAAAGGRLAPGAQPRSGAATPNNNAGGAGADERVIEILERMRKDRVADVSQESWRK